MNEPSDHDVVVIGSGVGGLGDEPTLEEWARGYTKNKTLLSLFDSLTGVIFTVNADEMPAQVFIDYLRETGGFKTFGLAVDALLHDGLLLPEGGY